MQELTRQFYDDLAPDYHLIHADWHAAMRRQAEVLDGIIRGQVAVWPASVLDCTCGIGTQAIGLSLRGYQVQATDLSAEAVGRARRLADELGAALTFGVADVRSLAEQVAGQFDVILSCDNALPHLLLDSDLRLAARNLWAKLAPGGLLVASTRDYDALLEQKPPIEMPRVFEGAEGRRVVFQVWDWDPNEPVYTMHHYIVREDGEGWTTSHRTVKYRALRRDDLSGVLREAGFRDIRWSLPAESGYFQPLVTAHKPAAAE
jgi:glycine/sarcosine N-methyltransferase